MDGTFHPHFTPTHASAYTEWFTPADGFTVSDWAIVHLEEHIFYVYLDGSFSTNQIPANGERSIGSYKAEYFGKSLAGYIPCHLTAVSDSGVFSGMVQFFTSGGITVRGATHAANHVRASGMIARRDDV